MCVNNPNFVREISLCGPYVGQNTCVMIVIVACLVFAVVSCGGERSPYLLVRLASDSHLERHSCDLFARWYLAATSPPFMSHLVSASVTTPAPQSEAWSCSWDGLTNQWIIQAAAERCVTGSCVLHGMHGH